MSATNDFENIQVGDKVIVIYGGSYVRPVTRVTPTRFTAIYEFRKKDGRQVGSTWGAYANIATPERIQEIAAEEEKRKLWHEISETRWRDLDLPTLRAVKAALQQGKEKP